MKMSSFCHDFSCYVDFNVVIMIIMMQFCYVSFCAGFQHSKAVYASFMVSVRLKNLYNFHKCIVLIKMQSFLVFLYWFLHSAVSYASSIMFLPESRILLLLRMYYLHHSDVCFFGFSQSYSAQSGFLFFCYVLVRDFRRNSCLKLFMHFSMLIVMRHLDHFQSVD